MNTSCSNADERMSESAYTNTHNQTLDSTFYCFYTVHTNTMHVWMSRDNRYQSVKLCFVLSKANYSKKF